jgi:hypothetical protein
MRLADPRYAGISIHVDATPLPDHFEVEFCDRDFTTGSAKGEGCPRARRHAIVLVARRPKPNARVLLDFGHPRPDLSTTELKRIAFAAVSAELDLRTRRSPASTVAAIRWTGCRSPA